MSETWEKLKNRLKRGKETLVRSVTKKKILGKTFLAKQFTTIIRQIIDKANLAVGFVGLKHHVQVAPPAI